MDFAIDVQGSDTACYELSILRAEVEDQYKVMMHILSYLDVLIFIGADKGIIAFFQTYGGLGSMPREDYGIVRQDV